MITKDNFDHAVYGFLAGFMFLFIILVVFGKLPGDVYDRAVRDCMDGKVHVEITADTIYRAP